MHFSTVAGFIRVDLPLLLSVRVKHRSGIDEGSLWAFLVNVAGSDYVNRMLGRLPGIISIDLFADHFGHDDVSGDPLLNDD